MTPLGTVLTRCRSRRPDLLGLDRAVTAAARLRRTLALVPTGGGTVCFRVGGNALDHTRAEIIAGTAGNSALYNTVARDFSGRCTARCWRRGGDVVMLSRDLGDVAGQLTRAGFGNTLRFAALDFAEDGGRTRTLSLVYLFDRGTFYPSAAPQHRGRDVVLERRARVALAGVLPLESELSCR